MLRKASFPTSPSHCTASAPYCLRCTPHLHLRPVIPDAQEGKLPHHALGHHSAGDGHRDGCFIFGTIGEPLVKLLRGSTVRQYIIMIMEGARGGKVNKMVSSGMSVLPPPNELF